MSQNIDLRQYQNPSNEVLNDNTVADTSNLETNIKKLQDKIKEIKNKSGKIDKKKLEIEFKNLHEKFPTIFNKIIDGTMEMGRLKFMLKMIKDIETKKISKHQASVTVGQELVNNIVKPQMNNK